MSELFDPTGPEPIQLPTLFSRTNTGAIQQWTVLIRGDSYYTIHGQQNGQLQTTMPTVCKPKNEGKKNGTTGEQQALREADALWKKKKAAGSYESIADIDTVSFTEPMLAKNYDDRKGELKYPLFAQPKLDGIRCLVRKDGMWSRNGKKFVNAPHIYEQLKYIFELCPDLVFDGELYCDKFANDFNAICSLVKKSKPTPEDIAESAEHLQYWIYDIADPDKTFGDRTMYVCDFVNAVNHPSIVAVRTHLVDCEATLDKLYEQWVDQGYEGQMVRTNTKYEFKRSKGLLKRKEFRDAEYRVIGYVEGEGNKTGMLGALVFENHLQKQFNSNIKGTRDYLRELWAKKEELIGKLATVKYFNLTPGDEIPRFPYVTAIRDYE